MAQRFTPDSIKDSRQLFTLLQSMALQIDKANREIDLLRIDRGRGKPLTLSDLRVIRAALQASGLAPLNVSQLAGLLAQSQRGFAVVATSVSELQAIKPDLYEIGTLGLVTSPVSLYYVAEGVPRTWAGPIISTGGTSGNLVTTDTAQTITALKTITAGLRMGDGTGSPFIRIDGAAGGVRDLRFQSNALSRWFLRANSNAEAGSNVGTDLDLLSFDDAGALLRTLVSFTRANGDITIAGPNGTTMRLTTQMEDLTLSTVGTTTDTANSGILPTGGIILAVLTRITTAISGGGVTRYRIGDPTTSNRFFGDSLALGLGSGIIALNHWQGSVATDAAGPVQSANTSARITTDAAPTAGKVRIVTFALVYISPTT